MQKVKSLLFINDTNHAFELLVPKQLFDSLADEIREAPWNPSYKIVINESETYAIEIHIGGLIIRWF